MRIYFVINKTVLSICFVLIICFSFAQSDCNCDSIISKSELVLLNKRDSLEVFKIVNKFKDSKIKGCNYKGKSLEFQYYCIQKQLDKAFSLLETQEELLHELNCKNELMYDFYANKTLYYRASNNLEKLSEFAFKSLKEAEKLKDKEKQIESIQQIVHLFTRMQESNKNWKYIKRAEQLIFKIKKSSKIHEYYRWLAYEYENKYTRTERKTLIDSGLAYINIAKKDAFKYKQLDEITMLYRVSEAFMYHKRDFNKALVYIDSAIYYGKKIKGVKILSGLYHSKAWDYLDLNQKSEAVKWTDSALFYDYPKRSAANMMLHFDASNLYEQSGRLDKALKSFKVYSKLKDSILNEKRINIVNDLETKYKTELKDKEIVKKQSQINKLIALVITIALFGAIILFVIKTIQLRKVKTINTSLSQAIEKQKQLENEITNVRDNLAQDFHDDLGNKLARLSFLSKMITNDKSITDSRINTKIKQITEDANSLYVGTRDFVFSLKSNSDCLEEVVTYLSDFGEEYFSKTDIKFVVKKEITNIKLPHYWSKQLVYIFKEAMTNALKYAKGNTVVLSFEYINSQLNIACIDDGIGINENDLNSKNGLLNMKKRAKIIDGKLIIKFNKDKGTTIQFLGKTT